MDKAEAIKILKDFHDESAIFSVRTALETLHPELKMSEDEKTRKEIISFIQDDIDEINLKVSGDYDDRDEDDIAHQNWCKKAIAWLEKQGTPNQVSIWEHWKDGICGNGEGKLIYLIKNGDDYSLSSSLGYECDYILLSDLDNLMLEKQRKPRMQNGITINGVEYELIKDDEADECERCALKELCEPKEEKVLCISIFTEYVATNHRFEKKQNE